jgi:NADH-quinone oxidoreductase subunit C
MSEPPSESPSGSSVKVGDGTAAGGGTAAGTHGQDGLRSALIEHVSGLLGPDVERRIAVECGDLVLHCPKDRLTSLLTILKTSPHFDFRALLDVTAVDWLDQKESRFQVVYQLLSISKSRRLMVKVEVPEDNPEVDSAVPLWKSANFLEREVWDMFGIKFTGHPDLRRILLYEEFVGHPLRKDYPVQGKQPRVPLRMPEVENTARQMKRPDLVAIRPKVSSGGSNPGGALTSGAVTSGVGGKGV